MEYDISMGTYLVAFALTWSIESAVVFLFLRRAGWRRVLGVELVVNLATHPWLWLVLLRLPGPYLRNLFLAEIVVFAVEAALALRLYRGYGTKTRIAGAVVAANFVTFLLTFAV